MTLKIDKSLTEEELVKGCRRQKMRAQRELYERFSPRMLGVCLRYIQDRSEAESVMCSGFMVVFEKIDQFRGDGSFEGWIRRIMVNQSLGYIRKNRNMTVQTELEVVEGQGDLSQADHLEAEDLMNLVMEMPVGYRMVFNLYAIEGYSHKEIAEMLEINVNTSKSQLNRGRKWLQSRLKQLDDEIKRSL